MYTLSENKNIWHEVLNTVGTLYRLQLSFSYSSKTFFHNKVQFKTNSLDCDHDPLFKIILIFYNLINYDAEKNQMLSVCKLKGNNFESR